MTPASGTRSTGAISDTKFKESPFTQATEAMHEIERCIKRDLSDQKPARALFGFGVAFPDVEFTAESPEWDNSVVYDSRDRQKPFTTYINRLAQFHRSSGKDKKRPSLKPDVIKELASYLRANFDLIPPSDLILDGVREQLD